MLRIYPSSDAFGATFPHPPQKCFAFLGTPVRGKAIQNASSLYNATVGHIRKGENRLPPWGKLSSR